MLKFIFILVVIFYFWYRNAKIKGSFVCSSSILIGIYLASAIFAIPTISIGEYKEPLLLSYWWPAVLFLGYLLFLLLPARVFQDNKVSQLILPNRKTLSIMATVIILLSLFSIFYYSRTVSGIFLMNLNDARTDIYLGEEFVEAGWVNTIASVSASLYVFALLLFFIYCTIPSSKFIRILLLLSSLSEPLHILAYVGRDGIVFWLFSFVFLFTIFRGYMEPKTKSFLKKLFIIAAALLIIPFFLITMSRFGSEGTNSQGAFDSMINYWGQGYIQGTLFMGIDEKPCTYGASFPLFYEITGITKPAATGMSGMSGMVQIGEWRSWFFGTIVTGLLLNLGHVGFWIVSIFSLVLFYGIMRIRSGRLLFHQLIYYILYFQIMSQGVFYFKQYTRGGNLFILLSFLLVLFFKLTYNSDSAIRIERKS